MRHHDTGPDFERIRTLSRQGRLYFGFGSNLNAEDYASGNREPLDAICAAFVPDAALVFDRSSESREGGVLSLCETPGGFVDGWLFEVKGWNELDAKEEIRIRRYVRLSVPVLIRDPSSGICRYEIAQSYVTASPGEFVRPGDDYLRLCMQGREALGLSSLDLRLAAEGQPNGFGGDTFAIFTYGTLCRGESRARVMRTRPVVDVSLAEMQRVTLWLHSSGEFPCLLAADPDSDEPDSVIGDLWTYRADGANAQSLSKLFPRLDAIESDARPTIDNLRKIVLAKLERNLSVDEASAVTRNLIEESIVDSNHSEFRRTLVDVISDGQHRRAWTYFYCGPMTGLLPITSGNWRKYAGRWDESQATGSHTEQGGP